MNLQELRAIKAELIDRVCQNAGPCRCVNMTDSRVSLGSWGNGRSSSVQVNGILRFCIGWSILGRVKLAKVWVASDKNPGDHPPRFRPVPAAVDLPPDSPFRPCFEAGARTEQGPGIEAEEAGAPPIARGE